MQYIEVKVFNGCPKVDPQPLLKGFTAWSGKQHSDFWRMLVLLGLAAGLIWAGPPNLPAATRSPKQGIVPNWSRFEQAFLSTIDYTNALQEANLTAVFTSPLGERRIVNGFWDGGRVWRVRFCPDMAGQWTYTTFCSDPNNSGLYGHTGSFLCTPPIGEGIFQLHGPVRVARDHRHLEHADGTPFFWLADSAGRGAFLAGVKEWQRYATIRASQLFNVVVWSATPQEDYQNESALIGLPNRIGVNPAVFQRLDAKLDALNGEGLLSAIVPFSEQQFGVSVKSLPEDQAALLLNYMVARWGSEPVAWVVDLESEASTDQVDCWKKIGRAVFTNSIHAPVVVFSSQSSRPESQFLNQSWVDCFGIRALRDSGPGGGSLDNAGSLRETARVKEYPIILLAPRENGLEAQSHKRFDPDDVRHAVYERLFTAPPAGVTYAAQGVVDWDTSANPSKTAHSDDALPMWEKALFLPAAKQMQSLAKLMNTVDFWRLRPELDAVPSQLSQEHVVAASTSARDVTLLYLPKANPVDVYVQAMPLSPRINWIEPRQGYTRSAVAVVSGSTCQFPPPGEGDWVLLMTSGK